VNFGCKKASLDYNPVQEERPIAVGCEVAIHRQTWIIEQLFYILFAQRTRELVAKRKHAVEKAK
jgi:hypothetical protein